MAELNHRVHVKSIPIKLTVTYSRIWRLRQWLGLRLVRLGAQVLRADVEVRQVGNIRFG